jgi:hypothetical protein
MPGMDAIDQSIVRLLARHGGGPAADRPRLSSLPGTAEAAT